VDDHKSPMRELVSEAQQTAYRSIGSLAEARRTPDAMVIFEGDDGGQIYLACPARHVAAGEGELTALFVRIDEDQWPGNGTNSRRVCYEVVPAGQGIPGGMGGAVASSGLWLHPHLEHAGWRQQIESVLMTQGGAAHDGADARPVQTDLPGTPADPARTDDDALLPAPGPPFRVGETIAFFPAEVGPTSLWLAWDDAVIEEISAEAQSFRFHFVSEPGVRRGQGLENVVRKTANYDAWTATWKREFERTGSEEAADAAAHELWLRVLAEHPMHGSAGMSRHRALG